MNARIVRGGCNILMEIQLGQDIVKRLASKFADIKVRNIIPQQRKTQQTTSPKNKRCNKIILEKYTDETP
jgi:hypothetical protein